MKNQKNRIIIALLCVTAIFVVSCKDQIIENTSSLSTKVMGDYYRGIDVKTDPRYGTFLSFGSLEQVKKLSVSYLDGLPQEKLIEWSRNIDHEFQSQLILSQTDDEFASKTALVDPSAAAILNKSGYVMIDNQIYRFYDQIGSYELLRPDGTLEKKVNVADKLSLSNAKVAACKSKQTKTVSNSAYNCSSYANKEYYVYGTIAYTSPVFSSQKIILTTKCYRQPCGSAQTSLYSATKLQTEVSYDLIVDGVAKQGQVQKTIAYNTSTSTTTLAAGTNICLGFVITKHMAYPTSSTYLFVDNAIQWLI